MGEHMNNFKKPDKVIAEVCEDLRVLRLRVKRAPKRREVPAWSAPLELWRALLFPNSRISTKGMGVGAAEGKICNA